MKWLWSRVKRNLILRLSDKPLKQQEKQREYHRHAEYCAPIYRVHWEQRAAPKFTDFVWACNPAWRISRPVLFPGTWTGEVHTPPSARYHAWHYERNGLKNHVCYCKRHRGSQQRQDGGIKFPRFFIEKAVWNVAVCGVFLLSCFGKIRFSM